MIRKIFSYQTARALLWTLFTLVTLITLLFMWTNWSGRRRWAATKSMIEKEGETLNFRDLLPTAPPDSQNLLALDPLKGIAEVIDNDSNKGEPGAKRAALMAMNWSGKAPSLHGVALGKATGMKEWEGVLKDPKFINLPPQSEVTGAEVLAALDAKFPLLKQMADEAPHRQQAMYTPSLREREIPGLLFSLQLAHYNGGGQILSRLLALRARAAIDAKNGVEAAHSLLAASRLAHACKQEPLLIGLLVAVSIDSTAHESLWHGLRERVFSDSELQLLQAVYAKDETAKAWLQAMRGELAAGLDSLEYAQDAAAGKKQQDAKLVASIISDATGLTMQACRFIPNGLFDHWKSVLGEVEMRHLILPLKNGIPTALEAAEILQQEIRGKSNPILHPDWIMARLILPAVKQVSLNSCLAIARSRQALTAIALERFFAKHGSYPAKLDELTPDFLQSVPLDPCDGKPLRYQTTDSGRFRLWSVGFDGKDDASKVNLKSDGTHKLHEDKYVGDWTWQYEPVK